MVGEMRWMLMGVVVNRLLSEECSVSLAFWHCFELGERL